jgi:hypothetical protein
MKAHSLQVETRHLIKALNQLCRTEKRAERVYLKYSPGQLTVSMGRTQHEVVADGSWPEPVSVMRKWATTFCKLPPEAAITTLQVADGKLFARDFAVTCSVGTDCPDDYAIDRQRRIGYTLRSLGHYRVTEQDINGLIERADRSKAELWGAGDERVIGDVSAAWSQLVFYGVEPSDIRRLLDQKSRDLWKSPPKRR